MRRVRSFMLGPAENLRGWELARVAIPLWILAFIEVAAHL
jgi:hypothetical protein